MRLGEWRFEVGGVVGVVGVVVVGGVVGWGVDLEGVGARVELEWSVVVGRVGVGVVESER